MSEGQLVAIMVLAFIGAVAIAMTAGKRDHTAYILRICGGVFILPAMTMLWRYALLGG